MNYWSVSSSGMVILRDGKMKTGWAILLPNGINRCYELHHFGDSRVQTAYGDFGALLRGVQRSVGTDPKGLIKLFLLACPVQSSSWWRWSDSNQHAYCEVSSEVGLARVLVTYQDGGEKRIRIEFVPTDLPGLLDWSFRGSWSDVNLLVSAAYQREAPWLVEALAGLPAPWGGGELGEKKHSPEFLWRKPWYRDEKVPTDTLLTTVVFKSYRVEIRVGSSPTP